MIRHSSSTVYGKTQLLRRRYLHGSIWLSLSCRRRLVVVESRHSLCRSARLGLITIGAINACTSQCLRQSTFKHGQHKAFAVVFDKFDVLVVVYILFVYSQKIMFSSCRPHCILAATSSLLARKHLVIAVMPSPFCCCVITTLSLQVNSIGADASLSATSAPAPRRHNLTTINI